MVLLTAAILAASPSDPRAAAPGAGSAAGSLPAAGSAAGAGESTPADGSATVEIALRTHDGHAFSGLYASPPSSGSNALLVVPDLGQKRDHFLRLVASLRARGYRVLSMDNTGQLRQVKRGPNAMPTFTPMSTKILDVLVQDVGSGLTGLRAQPGVGRVGILGFGIGANAALLAAGDDPTVAVVAAVVPNYGCDEFDPYAAFGDMNSRPVLLAESKKKYHSDISIAFEHIMAKRKDLPLQHVALKRDSEDLTQRDLEEDYEDAVLAWLDKAFPSASH